MLETDYSYLQDGQRMLMKYKLPDGLTCEHCILQVHRRTNRRKKKVRHERKQTKEQTRWFPALILASILFLKNTNNNNYSFTT